MVNEGGWGKIKKLKKIREIKTIEIVCREVTILMTQRENQLYLSSCTSFPNNEQRSVLFRIQRKRDLIC